MRQKIRQSGIWVIGDVHGEFNKMKSLIKKLPQDAAICFSGDLIDRGTHSAQVVEHIIKNNYYCVLGNHEQMMIEDQLGITTKDWREYFGAETLSSYKKFSNQIYLSHINWIKTLSYYLHFEIEGHKPL